MATQTAARITFVRVALAGGLALVAAQSVAHLAVALGATLDFDESDSVFDLHGSNSVPDVVSTLIIVAAALGAVLVAGDDRVGRVQARMLAIVLLVVGTDDALHTRVDGTGAYELVVIGTLLTAAILMTWVAIRVRGATRTCLLVGLVLLVFDVKAAFVYDQLMNTVGQPWVHRGDFLYELGIVLDEGIELFAWTLVAVGLWNVALAARTATTESRAGGGLEVG